MPWACHHFMGNVLSYLAPRCTSLLAPWGISLNVPEKRRPSPPRQSGGEEVLSSNKYFFKMLCFLLDYGDVKTKTTKQELTVGNFTIRSFSSRFPHRLVGPDLKRDRSRHGNRMQNKALYGNLQMSLTFINHSWFLHSQKLQSRKP